MLCAEAIVNAIGKKSDAAFFILGLFFLKEQVVFLITNKETENAHGLKRFQIMETFACFSLCFIILVIPILVSVRLAIILIIPPMSQLLFAFISKVRLFQPFGGGVGFATLQGVAWSAYACLATDILLLTSCALPTESQLAMYFNLNEPRTLGILGVISHTALLSSFRFFCQSTLVEWSPISDVVGVLALTLAALALGLSLALQADHTDTEHLVTVLLGLNSSINEQDLRLISILAGLSGTPVFLLGHRPYVLLPLPFLEILAFILYFLGGFLINIEQRQVSGACLLLTSTVFLLASRRAPWVKHSKLRRQLPTKQEICLLLTLVVSSNKKQQRWPTHLTRVVASFLFEEPDDINSKLYHSRHRRRIGRRELMISSHHHQN